MKTPSIVKTIKDLIYYRYAKIIADSSGIGKDSFGFIVSKTKELQSGKMEWSGAIREFTKQSEVGKICEYCGSIENISLDHLIPQSKMKNESADNAVWACKSCNSSKGNKGLYEWYGYDRRNDVPRIAEGKYLKLLYELHKENGTLDMNLEDIKNNLCGKCNNKYLCDKYIEAGEAKESILTIYCLESVILKSFKVTK